MCNTCRTAVSLSVVLLILALTFSQSLLAKGPVTEPSTQLRQKYGLPSFYRKILITNGWVITASERVSDFALYEVAYLVDQMLAGNNEVRHSIIEADVRLVVMATTEVTTDIPEHAHLRPASYWDRRARGLGWSADAPIVSCGEENLLNFVGDPYDAENIFIHELAHAVHDVAMKRLAPEFDSRLDAAYKAAIKAGLWKHTYAATNRREYWAEGSQSWFNANANGGRVHNDINTREELSEYDPPLGCLLRELYGEGQWRYVRPKDRPVAGHLNGFQLSIDDTFSWPTGRNIVRPAPEPEVHR
jgi:hypothetical protein